MPRLFTALEVPSDIAFSLSLLRGGLPRARWIDPDNYHITLRFIGDVENRIAAEIADQLRQIQRPDFELSVQGLGTFGNRNPHAVWAGVASSPALVELHDEHERVMRRIGLEPERRKFTPHVTLARLRNAARAEVADYLALRGGFKAPPFIAGGFVLMSARESRGGGPYIREEAYPLQHRPGSRGDQCTTVMETGESWT